MSSVSIREFSYNPSAMFERMFQRKPDANPGDITKLRDMRLSILDAVKQDTGSLKTALDPRLRRSA